MMKISVAVNGNLKSFDLSQQPVLIGRETICDYTVSGSGSMTVSGKHVILQRVDGVLKIKDLGSSNGTFLNGSKCQTSTRVSLNDEIRLGREGPVVLLASEMSTSNDFSPVEIKAAGVNRLPSNRKFFSTENEPALPEDTKSQSRIVAHGSERGNQDGSSLPRKRSTTRRMLIALKKNNRTSWLVAVSTVASLILAGLMIAAFYWVQFSNEKLETQAGFTLIRESQEATRQELKDGLVEHRRSMQSEFEQLRNQKPLLYEACSLGTAFIKNFDVGGTTYGKGTGFLVDKDRGLVVTNHHVIDAGKEIHVWFPAYASPGKIETRLNYYLNGSNSPPLKAILIATDPSKDLALIKVDLGNRHAHIQPLELAKEVPRNGTEVFTFGHCGGVSDNGWTFSEGVVKNYWPDWQGDFDGQSVRANVLITDNTIEPGDSGGAVVNKQGKVVAVVSSKKTNFVTKKAIEKAMKNGAAEVEGPRIQNQFIAINELVRFLEKHRN